MGRLYCDHCKAPMIFVGDRAPEPEPAQPAVVEEKHSPPTPDIGEERNDRVFQEILLEMGLDPAEFQEDIT
jgi:hypothetical protein